jgi:MFS family permease
MGPIIGGAFADSSATWRWSFYINLCIGGVAAPVYLFLLPSTKPATVGTLRFMARIGRLDLIGTVLSTGAIATLVMATSFGGGVYAWKSGQIIGLFVSTGVLWLAFVLQQWFSVFTTPRDRLFPTELLKSWEMDILFVQMASAQVIVTIPIYFIPLYFQFAKDFTALHSGVELLPFVLLLVFAVMLNGALMAKFGYYMPWYAAGSAVTLVGSALLYTIDMETPKSRVYGYSILAAFGVGLFSQAGFPVAQVKSTPEQLQQAVAFMGIGQVGGITLALMMSNSIFLNRATDKVATILPDTAQTTIQQAILGFGNSFFYSLDVVERGKVLTAIVESIGDTFVLVITAATLCLVLSLFMKREKLFIDRVATT